MKQAAIFPRSRVTVVAVLNATPDSFSDGGRFVRDGAPVAVAAAVDAARAMLEAGAHVIDVGGESTRPGARPVPTAREIARTAPIVEALAKRFDAPISIDTRRADVAEAALEAGACAVNDVSGRTVCSRQGATSSYKAAMAPDAASADDGHAEEIETGEDDGDRQAGRGARQDGGRNPFVIAVEQDQDSVGGARSVGGCRARRE